VRAFEAGESMTRAWEAPVTHAAGLRVPSPFAGRQILQAIRESQGGAFAVSEESIVEAQRLLARLEGLWVSPEAASTVAALSCLRDRRALERRDRVVLISTGSGLKNDPPKTPGAVDLPGDVAASIAEIRRRIEEPAS
jgi:threonine synthase